MRRLTRLRPWCTVAAATLLLVACTGSGNKNTHEPSPTRTAVPAVVHPTVGATSVKAFGARGDGAGDDTAAFERAEDAALNGRVRYPHGPGGSPQAVVFVPAGSYRLLRLVFRSDVRVEVDAGAVFEQAGGRGVGGSGDPPALIVWDGPPGHALRNVSLVGVGSATGGRKSVADPVFAGWSVAEDFTFDLDPGYTDSNDLVTGIQALNVDGFLVQNVFSIENATQPSAPSKTDAGWWPQSRKAAFGLRERADTPADGSVYYDPHNGIVQNWYNVNAPKGFGPNQVNAGHNLKFEHIFSRGGTALRLETDASQGKSFASELRGVQASDIAGQNCNRAVSFAPHSQANYDVHVSDVLAVSCANGVVESVDATSVGSAGAFYDSTIANVSVAAGPQAQVGSASVSRLWTVGQSAQAFAKDGGQTAKWSVMYTYGTYGCSGHYAKPSAMLLTTVGWRRPVCS